MTDLPIISIQPYLPSLAHLHNQEDRLQSAEAIHKACREVGFFFLDVQGFLEKDEMDEVLNLGREFFDSSQKEKDRIGLEMSDGVRGYQKLHQNVTQGKADHHEGLDLYAPSPYPELSSTFSSSSSSSTSSQHAPPNFDLRPLEGPNLWPTRPPTFRQTMERWIDKMKILGMSVMRCMADGLGMSQSEWEDLRGLTDDSFWVMRVIGYPPLPDGADGISCGSHKDYGCLTFLHADPTPSSLQVLPATNIKTSSPSVTGSGTETEPNIQTETYINVTPLPNTLIVNIGSMWEIWSGGLYPATTHRVIHKSPTYRVSIPFFFEPNFNAKIELLEAAKRKAAEEGMSVLDDLGSVVYGDFLLQKIGGNFKY